MRERAKEFVVMIINDDMDVAVVTHPRQETWNPLFACIR